MAIPEDIAETRTQSAAQRAFPETVATDGVAPYLSHAELLALLNTLLEAERAGAKVLAVFLDEYEAGSDAWEQLKRVQRDEAGNCAILMQLIKGLGESPSTATGDFVAKALAVQGRIERLELLNRGQGWVARTIRNHLPRIAAGSVRATLAEMHDSHVTNIGACTSLVASLSTRSN